MSSPKELERRMLAAITHLAHQNGELTARLVALEAVVRAMLHVVPPQTLPRLSEVHDAAVDLQASQMAPDQQHARYWQDWAGLIDDLQHLPRP